VRAPVSRRALPFQFPSAPLVAGVTVLLLATGLGAAWYTGALRIPLFRETPERSTAGLVPVPSLPRPVPAYTRLTRDHFWDPAAARLSVIYLPPGAVTKDVLVNLGDILGRVLDHDKAAGFVFTGADFLPKGTREGIVAGIPAGKRAVRVPAEKVEGLYGLRIGDRFDLVATLPLDTSRNGAQGAQPFNFGGVYGPQLSLQARMSNWQKQATVRVIAQNAVVVEPLITRQIPVYANTLTQGGITRMRPVQEIVVAVDPDEVASLTEAMAVDAKIATVPRSGRPDDPPDSRTPGLRPVSPFTGPATGAPATDGAGEPFSVVETIMGPKRELSAVPRP